MATSKLEFPPVTTSSPLNISDFDHTPSYCEENVYMLCKKLSEIGVSKNDGFDLFVAFISNDHKQIHRAPVLAFISSIPLLEIQPIPRSLLGIGLGDPGETMCCYFDPVQDILEAVVITNRITRRSKGYGFVRHLRAMTPYFASGQSSRPYIGSPSYHQPVTYNYQQGFAHPQYGLLALSTSSTSQAVQVRTRRMKQFLEQLIVAS
ncbi:hypothetical protein IFM89_030216 [Coptis chinensis]|uniref:Protein N-terminal glutamine amidohydrolase alpha beta roll domain-containing protein n=1 Tax=Coptis chinensis TaxID=261450 RepID=A0A835HNB1_9MAGN|nr:hypothetical protein IFM89_030216 [Coptis chinensis]